MKSIFVVLTTRAFKWYPVIMVCQVFCHERKHDRLAFLLFTTALDSRYITIIKSFLFGFCIVFQKIKTIAMSCSYLASPWLSSICFCYGTDNLDQGVVEETSDDSCSCNKVRGRFSIVAYAKAKKMLRKRQILLLWPSLKN